MLQFFELQLDLLKVTFNTKVFRVCIPTQVIFNFLHVVLTIPHQVDQILFVLLQSLHFCFQLIFETFHLSVKLSLDGRKVALNHRDLVVLVVNYPLQALVQVLLVLDALVDFNSD
jgi:hypothetical protein